MKKQENIKTGIGTGYISIIMIFVVITISVLSVLSLSAAGSNEELGEKTREQMSAYYTADAAAKKILADIDGAAYEAAKDGFFTGFVFESMLSGDVSADKIPEGYRVSWETPVTDKRTLSCSVTVFSSPSDHGGKRYEINKWKTVSDTSAEEPVLSVWDGSF